VGAPGHGVSPTPEQRPSTALCTVASSHGVKATETGLRASRGCCPQPRRLRKALPVLSRAGGLQDPQPGLSLVPGSHKLPAGLCARGRGWPAPGCPAEPPPAPPRCPGTRGRRCWVAVTRQAPWGAATLALGAGLGAFSFLARLFIPLWHTARWGNSQEPRDGAGSPPAFPGADAVGSDPVLWILAHLVRPAALVLSPDAHCDGRVCRTSHPGTHTCTRWLPRPDPGTAFWGTERDPAAAWG